MHVSWVSVNIVTNRHKCPVPIHDHLPALPAGIGTMKRILLKEMAAGVNSQEDFFATVVAMLLSSSGERTAAREPWTLSVLSSSGVDGWMNVQMIAWIGL
jgi:hypothetical protein